MEKQRAAAIKFTIDEIRVEDEAQEEVLQSWLEGLSGALAVRAETLDIYDFLPSAITVTHDGRGDNGMTPEGLIGVLIHLSKRDLDVSEASPIKSNHVAARVVELFSEEGDYLTFSNDEVAA